MEMMFKKLFFVLLMVLLGGVSAYSFRTYPQVGDTLVFNNDQFRGSLKVLSLNPCEVAVLKDDNKRIEPDRFDKIPEDVIYSYGVSADFASGYNKFIKFKIVSLGLPEDKDNQNISYINYIYHEHNRYSTVTIPSGVRFISNYFFSGVLCERFEMDENDYFDTTDGCLIEKSTSTLIKFPALAPMMSYKLPESIKQIAPFSFYGSFVEVSLHDEITEIPDFSFCFYSSKSFSFPKHVKKIGTYAFAFSNLGAIRIPDGVEQINEGAFAEGFSDSVKYQDDIYYGAIRFAVIPALNHPVRDTCFDIKVYVRFEEIYSNTVHYIYPYYCWDIPDYDKEAVFNYVFLSENQQIEKFAFPDNPDMEIYGRNQRVYRKHYDNLYDGWCNVYVPAGSESYYSQCLKDNLLPQESKIMTFTGDYFFLDSYLGAGMWVNGRRKMSYALVYGGDIKPVSFEWSVDDPDILSVDEEGIISVLKEGDTTVWLTVEDSTGKIWKSSKSIHVGEEQTGIIAPADENHDTFMKDSGVYTLQGIRVGDNIDELPAGLYICGGKKILKR